MRVENWHLLGRLRFGSNGGARGVPCGPDHFAADQAEYSELQRAGSYVCGVASNGLAASLDGKVINLGNGFNRTNTGELEMSALGLDLNKKLASAFNTPSPFNPQIHRLHYDTPYLTSKTTTL